MQKRSYFGSACASTPSRLLEEAGYAQHVWLAARGAAHRFLNSSTATATQQASSARMTHTDAEQSDKLCGVSDAGPGPAHDTEV